MRVWYIKEHIGNETTVTVMLHMKRIRKNYNNQQNKTKKFEIKKTKCHKKIKS